MTATATVAEPSKTTADTEPAYILKAFRFALDPRPSQREALSRHAGSARWGFNWALAQKREAHQTWLGEVEKLVQEGVPEKEARKRVKTPIPTKPAIHKKWVQKRGDDRDGTEGICPWFHTINSYAFQSAFMDADAAWKNWVSSFRGERAGRRVGYPRFKKKGVARDSFRLHHDTKRPTIRLATYRRINLPRIGEVRLKETAKRLGRLVNSGKAVIQSATVSRGGDRWYVSVLCKVRADEVLRPTTQAQRAAGTVGVRLGITHLATLSRPWPDAPGDIAHSTVANPGWLARSTKRLAKAQRSLSRTSRGSSRREKAKAEVGRIHHRIALQRNDHLNQITTRLARNFNRVGVYDLDVAGLVTRPGKGGKKRRPDIADSSTLRRLLLDAAPGELRRQLEYKTSWFGSSLAVLPRDVPASKTCSECGRQKPSLTRSDQVFHCDHCGLRLPRPVNTARVIEKHAVVAEPSGSAAPRTGEAQNARGAPVRLPTPRGEQQEAMKREGVSP